MWKVICGDALFRIVAPDGQESAAVHYCSMATLTSKGVVHGCYLDGDEEDDEIFVRDLSAFPEMSTVPTEVEEAEFDGEDGTTVEVECPKCAGNGFLFVTPEEAAKLEAEAS
jgi:hypothetical protein